MVLKVNAKLDETHASSLVFRYTISGSVKGGLYIPKEVFDKRKKGPSKKISVKVKLW